MDRHAPVAQKHKNSNFLIGIPLYLVSSDVLLRLSTVYPELSFTLSVSKSIRIPQKDHQSTRHLNLNYLFNLHLKRSIQISL